MEKRQSEVVLFGSWASTFCTRVELALKVKGIPYEYVEEDLKNKSELLLSYNPVHKKIPVLVHNDKPIAESLVILEYIDECWKNTPKLLPEDPYQRAKVRFWANFYDQKIAPSFYIIIRSKGEEQERAIEDLSNLLRVFEEGIQKDFPEKSPLLDVDNLGLLGIVVGSQACNYQALHEAIAVVTIVPEKNPVFLSWVNALKDCPLMKETLPPHDKLVPRLAAMFNSPQV